MKKILYTILLVIISVSLTGCGGTNKINKDKTLEPSKIGDTLKLKNFDVQVINYSLQTAYSEKEKYQTLIFLEVNVTNTSGSARSFSTSLYDAYGPNDTELDRINIRNYTTAIVGFDAIRIGGTANGHIILPYMGNGEYWIVFDTGSKKTVAQLAFTIS